MPWGFRDQRNCVVSSVPNSMEITASNFPKLRPLMIPTGPIEFPQIINALRTVQIEVHVVHINNFTLRIASKIFHVTLLFYELDVGFYNLAMEGRFLLIPVDLRSLQLLLKYLSGFTIFTLYPNFLYFDTKCGFHFLHYSVFIFLFHLSIKYLICFQETKLCQSYSMQHQCNTQLDTPTTTKKET